MLRKGNAVQRAAFPAIASKDQAGRSFGVEEDGQIGLDVEDGALYKGAESVAATLTASSRRERAVGTNACCSS